MRRNFYGRLTHAHFVGHLFGCKALLMNQLQDGGLLLGKFLDFPTNRFVADGGLGYIFRHTLFNLRRINDMVQLIGIMRSQIILQKEFCDSVCPRFVWTIAIVSVPGFTNGD